jgi:hypothetical protein
MFGFAFALSLIISFSDDLMNYWNIFCDRRSCVFGGLYVARNRLSTYRIEKNGSRNLLDDALPEPLNRAIGRVTIINWQEN